jgi:hypothetical protein
VGYTISRASVVRNLDQLEHLYKLKTTLIFKNVANPQRLAYKLREAIAAAKHYEEFAHLADLDFMYQFRIGVNEVVAQYEVLEKQPTKAQDSQVTPKPKMPEKKTIPDAISLIDVLGFVLKFPKEHEILFPNAVLEADEKQRLYEWTQGDSIEWKFIDHEESGVTLTKKSVPEEVLWAPT